jgi:hypothetical protein
MKVIAGGDLPGREGRFSFRKAALMQVHHVEINDLEPMVVDLTIDHDEPVFSVRMPIYTPRPTHDRYYFEIRYKVAEGTLFMEFNLSDELINKLHSSKAVITNLPSMSPSQVPQPWTLGPIDQVQIAVKKLKDFHDREEWRPYIGQYVQF